MVDRLLPRPQAIIDPRMADLRVSQTGQAAAKATLPEARERRVIPMLNGQLQERQVLKQQREEGLVPTVGGRRVIPMSNDRAVKGQRVMLKPRDGKAVKRAEGDAGAPRQPGHSATADGCS